jgi:hypothetical protein
LAVEMDDWTVERWGWHWVVQSAGHLDALKVEHWAAGSVVCLAVRKVA